MSDFSKTIVTLVIAALMVGAVVLTRPVPATVAQFSDTGELFFPSFTDPLKARSLEVIEFDAQTAEYKPFKVEFDGKRWVIPSHNGYPASAETNMAEAAAAFIGLRKETVVGDSVQRHAELGVLDPADDKAAPTGRGTRVTIRDESGAVMSDLILGADQKTPDGQATGKRYARVPGKNRVYAIAFPRQISTRFADWINPDVLRVAGTIEKIRIDRYQIDERASVKRPIEMLDMHFEDVAVDPTPEQKAAGVTPPPMKKWVLADASPGGVAGPGQQFDSEKALDLADALRGLRIVGVRPKPEKLAELFSGSSEKVTLNPTDLLAMQDRGFYVTPDGQFLANEGELSFSLDDGISYQLCFGEVLFGEGETLTAGTNETPGSPNQAGPTGDDAVKPGVREARFLMVNMMLDESKLPKQPEEPKAPTPAEGATTVDPQTQGAYEIAKKQYEQEMEYYRRRMKMVTDRAAALQKEFAAWYYVIDGETYAKLRPTRAELVHASTPPATAPGTPTGSAESTPTSTLPAAPVPPAPTTAPSPQ